MPPQQHHQQHQHQQQQQEASGGSEDGGLHNGRQRRRGDGQWTPVRVATSTEPRRLAGSITALVLKQQHGSEPHPALHGCMVEAAGAVAVYRCGPKHLRVLSVKHFGVHGASNGKSWTGAIPYWESLVFWNASHLMERESIKSLCLLLLRAVRGIAIARHVLLQKNRRRPAEGEPSTAEGQRQKPPTASRDDPRPQPQPRLRVHRGNMATEPAMDLMAFPEWQDLVLDIEPRPRGDSGGAATASHRQQQQQRGQHAAGRRIGIILAPCPPGALESPVFGRHYDGYLGGGGGGVLKVESAGSAEFYQAQSTQPQLMRQQKTVQQVPEDGNDVLVYPRM